MSPFSFFFISVYVLLLFLVLSSGSFITLWLSMEFLMLTFMGIAFSFVMSSFSSLMILFIVQAVSSLMIMASFILNHPIFLTTFLLLKLGMFPFIFWFIISVTSLPTLLLGLISTIQKIPPFLMITLFENIYTPNIMWLSSLIGLLVLSLMMMSLTNYRTFLILSSICNNSWLFLSQLVSLFIFFLFVTVYSLNFLVLLTFFKSGLNIPSPKVSFKPSFTFLACLLSLSGLPPFPMFFVKLFTLLGVKFSLLEFSHLSLAILAANSFLVMSYMKFLFTFSVTFFSFTLLFL